MERLNLNRKVIRIEVNDDGDYIELNFGDADLPNRFMQLYSNLQTRLEKLKEDAAALEGDDKIKEQLEYYSTAHREIMADIDNLLGEGTCKKVFGDIVPDVDLVRELFEQLIPIINKYSAKFSPVQKYSAQRQGAK
ncbi:MAG: hypothetical protein E7300_01015 [Lachnospiraceae bacterium]|nr:hypothetical protein [Lachnospiraceae bacterium]